MLTLQTPPRPYLATSLKFYVANTMKVVIACDSVSASTRIQVSTAMSVSTTPAKQTAAVSRVYPHTPSPDSTPDRDDSVTSHSLRPTVGDDSQPPRSVKTQAASLVALAKTLWDEVSVLSC